MVKGTCFMPNEYREITHNVDGEPAHPIRALLPEYAAAVALGSRPAGQYADVAAHIEECAACQVELDDLLEVIEPLYAGAINPAPVYPPANLSFLEATVNDTDTIVVPWRFDAGRLMVAFSEPLLDALRQPTLAGVSRGRLLYRYIQEPGSVEDLDVAIEVYAEDAGQRQGRVRVCVDVPSRGPLDQTGSVVVLRAGGMRLEAATDESGQVDFAPVPLEDLPRLRVEIRPLERAV
jgi:hypothetical protein